MSSAATSGFFTLGVRPDLYNLPHPRLGLPVILLIRRILLRAFELLREQGCDLAAATEDQVTGALRTTIESRLRQTGEVSGFNKRTYEFVVRQGQWHNFDGREISKTPDLFFKLRDYVSPRDGVLSEFDGLFIEAKPMDSTHSAGSRYCDDGLIRFVRGDYAWAMQEAVMLAYTRDGRTISGHLIPAMGQADRMTSLATIHLPQACPSAAASACPEAEAVHISHHRRNFQWPNEKGPATDITVYHLWHRGST
jgi:hypothetical protein